MDYSRLRSGHDADALTAFERRAMELFVAGLDRHEIAMVLNRSPKTISNCLTVVKEKLGASTLAEAVVLFIAVNALN